MSQNQDNSKQQANQQNPSPGQQQSEPKKIHLSSLVHNNQTPNNLKKVMSSINNHYYFKIV